MVEPRVLMIVPTLGSRPELLEECLTSITEQREPVDIVIVAPSGKPAVTDLAGRLGAQLVDDPGSLAGAINLGATQASPRHEYLNWLGDDDLLEPGSLSSTVRALDENPAAALAYGACRYIDDLGRELWVSRAGRWAPRILSWGPDLIPQPGMLVRREAWESVGGLDESYKFAFDLDLLLRLRKLGRFIDVGAVVSAFRWHGDSLTVSDRSQSLAESERAKRASLPRGMRSLAWIWEGPVRIATRIAAREVSRRARRLTQVSAQAR